MSAHTITRTFALGDRVIAPGMPGHCDPIVRDGGPGRVERINPSSVVVVLDQQSGTSGYTFHPSELKPEPTI